MANHVQWPTVADVNPNRFIPNIGVVRYTNQTELPPMKVTIVVEAETLPQLAGALAIAMRSINLGDPRHLPKKIAQEGNGWQFMATMDIPEPGAEPAKV